MKSLILLIFMQIFVFQSQAGRCSKSLAKISAYTNNPIHKMRLSFLEKNPLFLEVLRETNIETEGLSASEYWESKKLTPHLKKLYKLFRRLESRKQKNKNQFLSRFELRNLAIALSPYEFPFQPFVSWRIRHFQYKKFLEEAISVRAEQILLEEKLKNILATKNITIKDNTYHEARRLFHRWKPFFQSAIHSSVFAGGFFLLQSDFMLEFSRFFPIYGPVDLAFLTLAPLLATDFFSAPSFYYRDLNQNFLRVYKEKGSKALADLYISEHPVLYGKEKVKFLSKSLLSPLNLISYAYLAHLLYSVAESHITTSSVEYINEGLQISQKYKEIQKLKFEEIDTLEEINNYKMNYKDDPYPLKKLVIGLSMDFSKPKVRESWLQEAKDELSLVTRNMLLLQYKDFYYNSYARYPDPANPDDYERFPSWVESISNE